MLNLFPKKLLIGILKRIDGYEIFHGYRKTRMKILRMTKRAKFLINCMQYSLIPNFLRFKIPENGVFNDEAVKQFQRRLLKLEISKTHKHLKDLENEIAKHRQLVQDRIPMVLWGPLVSVLHFDHITEGLKLDDTHKNKLLQLSEHFDRPIKDYYDNVKILDPDITLPNYVLNCLAMGPKHPVLDRFKCKEVLAETDCLLEYIEPKLIINNEGKNIDADTKNLIKIETHKYNKLMATKKLDTNYVKTLKYLKAHKLRAVPCDKANAFMIMSDEAYQERMKKIINGKEFVKYSKPLANAINPLLKSEDDINN